MAAAAVRLLLRRRAALPAAPRAQASPPPMPSLLRHHSSKPHHFLQAATAAVGSLQDKCCFQSSQPNVPSLKRNYSSKARQCCNAVKYTEIIMMMWFVNGVVKDLLKRAKMLKEISARIGKAGELLDAGLDDEAYAMYEKGLDDSLKVIAVYEKDLDDLAKGFGNIKGIIPLDTLEQLRTDCKEIEKSVKSMRQNLKKLSTAKQNLKFWQKINKWLNYVNVGLGASACVLLAALLRPLFPGPYSKLPSFLPAAAGALAGLPDMRRAQASPAPMPSLLRHHSSKPHQSPQAATSSVANLKDKCRFESSQANLPSLMRSYSSKAEQCCDTASYSETEVMQWFLSEVVKDIEKRSEMLSEINEKLKKVTELRDAGLEDESDAMFEDALDDTLKVFAVLEKDLDDLAKIFRSLNWIVSLDSLEKYQMTFKEFEKSLRSNRQKLKELSIAKETLKIWENNYKLLSKYVGVSSCVLLALLIFVGVFLA
ncbi:hypothetical protein EJB05_01944, partial [Eragrostis curvula]